MYMGFKMDNIAAKQILIIAIMIVFPKTNNADDILFDVRSNCVILYNVENGKQKKIFNYNNNDSLYVEIEYSFKTNGKIYLGITNIHVKNKARNRGQYTVWQYQIELESFNSKLIYIYQIYNNYEDRIETKNIYDGENISFVEKNIKLNKDCRDVSRFDTESKEVKKRKVITKDGALYLINDKEKQILYPRPKGFNDKFQYGYRDVDITSDGEYFIGIKENRPSFFRKIIIDTLYEYSFDLKTTRVIDVGNVYNPKYSMNNKYILYISKEIPNQYFGIIYNRFSKKKTKLDQTSSCYWLEEK